MTTSLVVGAGGLLGYVWSIGALVRLERERGIDLRSCSSFVGTSAGAVIVTQLVNGVRPREMLETQRALTKKKQSKEAKQASKQTWRPLSLSIVQRGIVDADVVALVSGLLPAGTRDPAFLAKPVAHLVQGQTRVDPRCRIVAVDVDDGRRVAFGGKHAPPASPHDAVCASCAVPGVFAPVVINDRRYVDGGVASPTSLDLVPAGVAEAIVVSPLSGPSSSSSLAARVERVVRARMTRLLDQEVRVVEQRGVKVTRIEPTLSELAVIGANVMDARRRGDVLSLFPQ